MLAVNDDANNNNQSYSEISNGDHLAFAQQSMYPRGHEFNSGVNYVNNKRLTSSLDSFHEENDNVGVSLKKRSKHHHSVNNSHAVPPGLSQPSIAMGPSVKHFNHMIFVNQQAEDGNAGRQTPMIAGMKSTKSINDYHLQQMNVPKAFRRPSNLNQFPGLKGYAWVEANGGAAAKGSGSSSSPVVMPETSPWIGMGNTTYLIPVKVLTVAELTIPQAVYLVFDYFGNISVSARHRDSYYPRISGQDLIRITSPEELHALTTGILPMDKIREMFQELQSWINENDGILPAAAREFLRGKDRERERELKKAKDSQRSSSVAATSEVSASSSTKKASTTALAKSTIDPNSSRMASGVIAQDFDNNLQNTQVRSMPHLKYQQNASVSHVLPVQTAHTPAAAHIRCDEEDLFGLLLKRKINELCDTFPSSVMESANNNESTQGLQQSDFELQSIVDNMLNEKDRLYLQKLSKSFQATSFWMVGLQVLRERPQYAKVLMLYARLITCAAASSDSSLGSSVRASLSHCKKSDPDLSLQMVRLMLDLLPYYVTPQPHHRIVLIAMLEAIKLLLSEFVVSDKTSTSASIVPVFIFDAMDCTRVLQLTSFYLFQAMPDQEILLSHLLPLLVVILMRFPHVHNRFLLLDGSQKSPKAARSGDNLDLVTLLFTLLSVFRQCKTTVKMVAAILKAITITEEKQVFCCYGSTSPPDASKNDAVSVALTNTGNDRCRLLIDVLLYHANDGVVVKCLCGAIWNLSIISTSVKYCLIANGVCEALVNVLALQYRCLGHSTADDNLLSVDIDNIPLQQILGAIWTISILPQAQSLLGSYTSSLSRYGSSDGLKLSQILVELLQDNLVRVPRLLDATSSVPSSAFVPSNVIGKDWIIDTLDQCCGIIANIADIPENHAQFLSTSLNMVAGDGSINPVMFNAVTCEELLVEVLRKYGLDSAKLCESACSAIWCLLERDQTTEQSTGSPFGMKLASMLSTKSDLACDVLVTVLSQHMNNEEVVRQSCGAIAMKLMKNSASRAIFGNDFPGNDLLIHTLESHLPSKVISAPGSDTSETFSPSPLVTLQILKAMKQMILLPSNAKAMLLGKVMLPLIECLSSERERLSSSTDTSSFTSTIREEIFTEVCEIISSLLNTCVTASSSQFIKYFAPASASPKKSASKLAASSSLSIFNGLLAQLIAFFDLSFKSPAIFVENNKSVLIKCARLLKQSVTLTSFLRLSIGVNASDDAKETAAASHKSLTMILVSIASAFLTSNPPSSGTSDSCEVLVNLLPAISTMVSALLKAPVVVSGSDATSSDSSTGSTENGRATSPHSQNNGTTSNDEGDKEVAQLMNFFCDQLLQIVIVSQSGLTARDVSAVGSNKLNTSLLVHVVSLLKRSLQWDTIPTPAIRCTNNYAVRDHLAKQKDLLPVFSRLLWKHSRRSNGNNDEETTESRAIVMSTLSLLALLTATASFYSQRDIQQSQTMLQLLETVLLYEHGDATDTNVIASHSGSLTVDSQVIMSLCKMIRNIMDFDPFLLDCSSRRQWFVSILTQVKDRFLLLKGSCTSEESSIVSSLTSSSISCSSEDVKKIDEVTAEISHAIQALDSVPVSTMINIMMNDEEQDSATTTAAVDHLLPQLYQEQQLQGHQYYQYASSQQQQSSEWNYNQIPLTMHSHHNHYQLPYSNNFPGSSTSNNNTTTNQGEGLFYFPQPQ